MNRIPYRIIFILVTISALVSACSSAGSAASGTAVPGSPTSASAGTSASGGQVPATGSVALNGAGATFPQPVYEQWIFAYQQVDQNTTLNYQGIGSGGGKKSIIDGTVDFAGSDSLLTSDEYTAGKDLQMLPSVAGAVVLIYNIPGITAADPPLVLDRSTLVGIYNATIKKWNDPALQKLNPELQSKLPDKAITVVHRSDGSGTTEMFTKALASFSPEWKAGASTSVQWPVDQAGSGMGGKGNPGVAAAVQNTPNSIGYVELQYAVGNKITFAQMINKAGTKLTANAASLASAMNDFANSFTDKLTNTIVDGPGPNSWPIAGYTYIIIHMQNMKDCTKAQSLVQFINWFETGPNPAQIATTLGYAAVPKPVQSQVLEKLKTVTCSGQPVMK